MFASSVMDTWSSVSDWNRLQGLVGADLHSSPIATCADARVCQERLVSGYDRFLLAIPWPQGTRQR